MKKLFLLALCAVISITAHAIGENIENAMPLTPGVASTFTSSCVDDVHLLYVKFEATNSGTVTINLDQPNTRARWMQEGVYAYGQLRQNLFRNGKEITVEKGKTYYCYYNFAAETTGTISFTLDAAQAGSLRSEAITLSAAGTQQLLGRAHEGEDFYNTTTWFRLDRAALADMQIMTVDVRGDVNTTIELFTNEETSYTKLYVINATAQAPVQFEIDLSKNDYYLAINVDDAGAKATFSFAHAQPGETLGTALDATLGTNNTVTGLWYRYTHTGNDYVTITTSAIYDASGSVIIEGSEAASSGIRMSDGSTVYFRATSSTTTIASRAIQPGETSENPYVITLNADYSAAFTFNMPSGSSDALRYMQVTAPDDGTFLYGTGNKNVVDVACGATVYDITNGSRKAVSVLQEQRTYDVKMFVYEWTVVAGHTYLIEQTLEYGMGAVEFLATFAPAAEGETIDKAIALTEAVPYSLGRKATKATYYKFTAPEAGDYLFSAHVTGYVKGYEDGRGYSIAKDYAGGSEFHNDVYTLAEGETVVFSAEPTTPIEHLGGGVQDFFIPDYYLVMSKVGTIGADISSADAIVTSGTIGNTNSWYGPISVPAEHTITVTVNDASVSGISAIFFSDTNAKWINNEKEVSYSVSGTSHQYVLAKALTDRTIYIMTNGMNTTGSFTIEGITSGITAPASVATSEDNIYYTPAGQRTSTPHSITIQKGKKFVLPF